jgi:Carbohydrate binding domain
MIRSFSLPIGAAILLCGANLISLPATARAETELIANDHFGDGGASWTLTSIPDGLASMSIERDGKEPVLSLAVQSGDEKPPNIRLQRTFGDIETEKTYSVKFSVKAANPTDIVAFIAPENEAARIQWRVSVKADTEWKNYSFTFKGHDTVTNCILGFSHLGQVANTYQLKDISLSVND